MDIERTSFKYARIEYERRFLIHPVGSGLEFGNRFRRVIDYYIPNTRLRTRWIETSDGRFLGGKLAQKFAEDTMHPSERVITNLYLNDRETATLRLLGGKKLVKHRYRLNESGQRISIDIFQENRRGLILAEVSAKTRKAVLEGSPPSFALEEVTADPFFTGGNLALISDEEFGIWLRERFSRAED